MRHRTFLPLLLGFVVLSTGCAATHREWEVWRAHPSHYATTNHLAFSMKNMVGAAPQVTPELMDQAKGEGWWGKSTPFVTPRANVAGRWEGTWSGYGMSRTLRGGVAQAVLTVDGATGHGRLALVDARMAEGVPLSLRENSSFVSSFTGPYQSTVFQNAVYLFKRAAHSDRITPGARSEVALSLAHFQESVFFKLRGNIS